MKTKPTIGILVLLMLLTTVYAQEEPINCKDIDYCINNHLNPIEISCIDKFGVGWNDECAEFQKAPTETSDEFNEYIKMIKQCRELISKGECELNMTECDELLTQANNIWSYKSAGECYVKFGQCKKAEEPYKKAMEMYEEKEENYVAVGMIYARLAACYNLINHTDKAKEYYKNAGHNYEKDGDELLKFYKESPKVFDNDFKGVANASAREYLYSARAYKAAEDYENACKSCKEADKYYKEIYNLTFDCKKYGCDGAKLSKHQEQTIENPKQPDYNLVLSIAIILITILLSAFVIWYKKFKR